MSSTPIYDELAARYLVDVDPPRRERPEAGAVRQNGAPATEPEPRDRSTARS